MRINLNMSWPDEYGVSKQNVIRQNFEKNAMKKIRLAMGGWSI